MIRPVKQKRCKVCKAQFTPFNSLAVACSPGCAISYARKQAAAHEMRIKRIEAKKQKERKAKERKEKADFRKTDVKWLKAKAQELCNKYIRLRDKDYGCISCDKPKDWDGQWHASHWKSVGSRPDLRFNEDNIHKACSQCNLWLSGNPIPYREELLRRIGEDRVLALEADHAQPKRMRASDYLEEIEKYREKLKALTG